MRLVFMGTPDFAVPSLRALLTGGHEVVAVYTQPDRPAGRGKLLRPSPVKTEALTAGVPVFQPEKIKTPEVLAELKGLNPECIVVVAYGQILSSQILQLPRRGCINVHASLLPRYRGAAPIHWAVMNGDKLTGITTMLMDEGLDTGDILLKKEYPIPAEATTGDIHDALAELGGELLLKTLQGLAAGTLRTVPQAGASNYAPMLVREHEKMDWQRSAYQLYNQVRGLNPWPGAFTGFRDDHLKVWQCRIYSKDNLSLPDREVRPGSGSGKPGTVLGLSQEGILVQTGDGLLEVLEVQPAGKRPMPAHDFWRGRHGNKGEVFGLP